MIAVALAALADRRPARLSWAQGKAEFAVNRRLIVDGKHTGYKSTPVGRCPRRFVIRCRPGCLAMIWRWCFSVAKSSRTTRCA